MNVSSAFASVGSYKGTSDTSGSPKHDFNVNILLHALSNSTSTGSSNIPTGFVLVGKDYVVF